MAAQVHLARNAIVVTGTTDIIDATCLARRKWNELHPDTLMPEGFANGSHNYVWFTRPGTWATFP